MSKPKSQVATSATFQHCLNRFTATPCNNPDDRCKGCAALPPSGVAHWFLCYSFPECDGKYREDGVSVVFLRSLGIDVVSVGGVA